MTHILVDENVPFARETFGTLGTVEFRHGRKITPEDVREADVLIVRSITRVDERLLGGSRVGFVGTATIGFDHIALDYLHSRGITFRSAPGSNANSVSEYMAAALLLAAERLGRRLEGSTLGVVGVGNVGSRVVRKAETLGMRCLLNDPPKQRQTGDARYLPLDRLLAESDFITLHVPLNKSGQDMTVGLAGDSFFEALKPGCVFCNTSRGQVVRERALKSALARGKVPLAVLDVWENEPDIDPDMVSRTLIGTPHIAGYSFDGKVAATGMLYEEVCSWLGRPVSVDWRTLMPAPPVPVVEVCGSDDDERALQKAILEVYDICRDDRDLRAAVGRPAKGAEFDLLRKNYPVRREFQNTLAVVPAGREGVASKAAGLGFKVARR